MAILSINNQLNTNYEHLSTMKRINSVADDIAGLSANGSNMNTKLPNSTLDALGIADYEIIGSFDIQKIEDIDKVSVARSCIEDLDVASYILDMNKNRILNDYRLFVQSSMTGQATRGISILLGSSS